MHGPSACFTWSTAVLPTKKCWRCRLGDPYSDGLNDLGDIPPHYLKEIEHFFQVYKDLEGTRTVTRGFEGADAARAAITDAMATYRKKFGD